MIFYKCDKERCNKCSSKIKNTGLCNHTSDVNFAKNFIKLPNGDYWEKEPEPIYLPIENEGEPVIMAIIGVISGFIAGAVFTGMFF